MNFQYKLFEMKNKVLEIISKGGVKGLAHITGGGFTENIPRVFPSGLGAKIFTGSWEVPPVFSWLQQARTNDPRYPTMIFIIYVCCIYTLPRSRYLLTYIVIIMYFVGWKY